jgi:hypothetical protein
VPMRQIDAEDEPTVLIKDWVSRDITTPPIVERQVGPPAYDGDGSLSGSDQAMAAPPREGVWWQLAASVAVAALLTAGLLVLR